MPLDLSAITDSLIKLVKSSWDCAPLWAELDQGSPPAPTNPSFTPNITGLAPDVLPKESGPQLGNLPLPRRDEQRHGVAVLGAAERRPASPAGASRCGSCRWRSTSTT